MYFTMQFILVGLQKNRIFWLKLPLLESTGWGLSLLPKRLTQEPSPGFMHMCSGQLAPRHRQHPSLCLIPALGDCSLFGATLEACELNQVTQPASSS